jgi:hypothetical protein
MIKDKFEEVFEEMKKVKLLPQRILGEDVAKNSFDIADAERLAKELGYTGDVEEFRKGLNIELEHGTRSPATNITNNDPTMTAKITLAHLNEIPDYNTRLLNLEKEGKSDKDQAKIPDIPENEPAPKPEEPVAEPKVYDQQPIEDATHGEVPFDTFDKTLNEEIDSWKADYYKKLFSRAQDCIHEVSAVLNMSFMKTPVQKLEEIHGIVDRADQDIGKLMSGD